MQSPEQLPGSSVPERTIGFRSKTRELLETVKTEIEQNKEKYKTESFDWNFFEQHLRRQIPKITDREIDWAKKQILRVLPESAREPLKSPEAAAVAGAAQDAIKTGLPRVTATEEKAKGWIESLKQRFSGFADIFPLIGSYFAGMAEAQKKEGKTSPFTSMYEKIAGWLGHETPKDKFEKVKTEVKFPEGFAFGESSDAEADINKSDGTKVGSIKYNAESGRITLVVGDRQFNYKDVAELNNNLPAKLSAIPEQVADNAEQAPENDVKKYTDLFNAKGWTLETVKLTDDLKTLKGSQVTDIEKYINDAFVSGSKVLQILEAIKESIPNDQTFKVRLTDLLFQKLSDGNLAGVLAVIKDENNYKLEKTPEKIREFLDEVNSAEAEELTGIFDRFKKKE